MPEEKRKIGHVQVVNNAVKKFRKLPRKEAGGTTSQCFKSFKLMRVKKTRSIIREK